MSRRIVPRRCSFDGNAKCFFGVGAQMGVGATYGKVKERQIRRKPRLNAKMTNKGSKGN